MTTLTCIADYLSWPAYTNAEKIELGKLYVPYLAVCESPLSLYIMLSPFYTAGHLWVDQYPRLSLALSPTDYHDIHSINTHDN